MSTNVDTKVAAILAKDKKALCKRGRAVADRMRSIQIKRMASKSESEWKKSAVNHIKDLILSVEYTFGEICVLLANKKYYSIEDLASSGNIVKPDDVKSDFARILFRGSDLVLLAENISQKTAENKSVKELISLWVTAYSIYHTIIWIMEEAKKLPENKAL